MMAQNNIGLTIVQLFIKFIPTLKTPIRTPLIIMQRQPIGEKNFFYHRRMNAGTFLGNVHVIRIAILFK